KIWDSTYRSRNPDAPQRISIGATAGAIAFVVVLVALLIHGRSLSHRHGFYSESQHTAQTLDLQGAKTAHARVEMGAGQLNINGGANHMLDADFTYDGTFDAPRVDYHVDGGVGQLSISQNSHSTHFGRSQNDWILRFGKDIPLDLKVDMGAGQGNLHLRDVPLTRLDLHMGAGQMDLDLTGDRKTDLTADIEGGVGQANIRLPKNVGVIAHASGGIGSITVVTGVSGSGKSSLAFDTIYAEGQRRYVESLSAYARQFLERMEKPDVDEISGIAPAVAIRQKNTTRNPRSTVATATEIYDYLRLLFARIGRTYCVNCGIEVKKDTVDEVFTALSQLPEDTRFHVLFPVTAAPAPGITGKKSRGRVKAAGTKKSELNDQLKERLGELRRRGFNRLYQN